MIASVSVLVLVAASGLLVTRATSDAIGVRLIGGPVGPDGAKALVRTTTRPTPDPPAEPSAPPSPSAPAPTAPTPAATPSPALPGEPADFSALVAEVAAARGLPAGPVNARVLSATALADKVASLDFGQDDPEQILADQRLLVSLRLIPPGTDLLALIRDLYAEQVLGLYVPEESTLYVGTGGTDLTPYEEVTAAHEITHALQDQAFGLEELRDLPTEETDASLALLSLIEGDAVLTQQVWQARNQTEQERADAFADLGGGSNDVLARTPPYLQAALTFPYGEGAIFTSTLFEQGGYAAIDAAFRAPPTTTEQIMHPERYTTLDPPVPVDVSSDPGAGWQEATTSAFGEFDLRELFAPLGGEAAGDLAAGWDGGQVVAWQQGEADATAFWLTFDTAEDAADVCAALPQWYAAEAGGQASDQPGVFTGDVDVLSLRCDGLDVRAGLAPDAATATALHSP